MIKECGQKSATYLVVKESLLHAIIGTNVLENIPSILLVNLPRKEAHNEGSKGNDGRDSHQIRLHIVPKLGSSHATLESIALLENIEGLGNLINLDGRVNHKGQVRETDTNDLNGVLLSESIPDDDEGVKETKNEKRQESRDSFVLRLNLGSADMGAKVDLELAEYIAR